MSIQRVTCTIPSDVLDAADAAARKLGRSRSWVVTEALRRFTAEPPPEPALVREQPRWPYTAEFDGARSALRDADLALGPAERLRAAEELAEEAARLRPRPRIREVLQFGNLEDYFAWKKRDLLW